MDEIILEIVRKMQPISSEEVWMEIGENLDFESNPSQEDKSKNEENGKGENSGKHQVEK